MTYYSYVLRSLENGMFYKGSTQNIEIRLATHNAGKVRFTSRHLPWELMFVEEFNSREEAVKREKWYKTGVGRDWIKKEIQNRENG